MSLWQEKYLHYKNVGVENEIISIYRLCHKLNGSRSDLSVYAGTEAAKCFN